jgi:hypothetical protein
MSYLGHQLVSHIPDKEPALVESHIPELRAHVSLYCNVVTCKHSFGSIASQYPIHSHDSERLDFSLEFKNYDSPDMNYSMEALQFPPESNEVWRKHYATVPALSMDPRVFEAVSKMFLKINHRLVEYPSHIRNSFEHAQFRLTNWIADRADHELEEYRKFWNIKGETHASH